MPQDEKDQKHEDALKAPIFAAVGFYLIIAGATHVLKTEWGWLQTLAVLASFALAGFFGWRAWRR